MTDLVEPMPFGMTNENEPQHPFGRHEADCHARDGFGCNCKYAKQVIKRRRPFGSDET